MRSVRRQPSAHVKSRCVQSGSRRRSTPTSTRCVRNSTITIRRSTIALLKSQLELAGMVPEVWEAHFDDEQAASNEFAGAEANGRPRSGASRAGAGAGPGRQGAGELQRVGRQQRGGVYPAHAGEQDSKSQAGLPQGARGGRFFYSGSDAAKSRAVREFAALRAEYLCRAGGDCDTLAADGTAPPERLVLFTGQ